MVNRVILVGNLGKDPEVRRLENGAVVAKLRLATNENYKDKTGQWVKQTEWHDVVAWRNLGERAESSLKTGDSVYVEGKLSTRNWQDQDGNNRRTTEVVASYFRIISRSDSDSQSSSYNDAGRVANDSNDTAAEPTEDYAVTASTEGAGKNSNSEDDLPF